MTSIARSNLLYHKDEDESYFSADKPSSYRRSNLQSTSSFRQKYKGFRSRSSSYTSLDEKHQETGSLNCKETAPFSTSSIFSRKKLGMTSERSNTTPAAYFTANKQEYSDDDSDENTFFAKQSNYSRQNLGNKTTSSWKSCVLRAVGVKK